MQRPLRDCFIVFLLLLMTAAQAQAGDPLDLKPTLAEDIAWLQTEWARIKYQAPDDDSKIAGYNRLGEYAARVNAVYPQHAEPKIWEAIILSSEAGVKKGLSSLWKVIRARELLESAIAIDETALDGSAHASLGSLYYQVPGWPVSFGSNDKAEHHLKAALAINPDGIDPNFFYGDYLMSRKKYEQAAAVLRHALEAAPRTGRELADAGRRQEIRAALAEAQRRLPTTAGRTEAR